MSGDTPTVSKEALEKRFRESGECERVKELLLQRLRETGWMEKVETMCKNYIQEKGIENVTVDEVVSGVTGQARRAVPEEVKRELMLRIRTFLQQESGIGDL